MHDSRTLDSEFVEFSTGALPSLRRVAYAWTRDWHSADDAVQTSMEKLYRVWRRVHAGGDPYPYVRKILIHVLMADSRSGWKRLERPTDRIEDHDRVVEVQLPDGDVAAAIAQLPPRQRAIVILRYLEDMSVEDVAAAMKCSPGTVKSQSSSARASLEKTLLPTNEKVATDD